MLNVIYVEEKKRRKKGSRNVAREVRAKGEGRKEEELNLYVKGKKKTEKKKNAGGGKKAKR